MKLIADAAFLSGERLSSQFVTQCGRRHEPKHETQTLKNMRVEQAYATLVKMCMFIIITN